MAKDRKKRQKEARENNKLNKTITPQKREQGRQLIIFLSGMVVVAAGLVIYLQS